jgi:hypothetical protein
MNIREKLRAAHNKSTTLRITAYIGTDPKRFRELMDIFLEGEYRLTQRAAWPMSYVAEEHPQLVRPYFKKLIQVLRNETLHAACARNILRIFQTAEIPEKYEAEIFDFCLGAMVSTKQPVAIRAFSISVAARITARYPELKGEYLQVLGVAADMPQTAAIKHRIKTAIKALQRAEPI